MTDSHCRPKNIFQRGSAQTPLLRLDTLSCTLLLVHRLFHADRVGHQLQVAQNLGLFFRYSGVSAEDLGRRTE